MPRTTRSLPTRRTGRPRPALAIVALAVAAVTVACGDAMTSRREEATDSVSVSPAAAAPQPAADMLAAPAAIAERSNFAKVASAEAGASSSSGVDRATTSAAAAATQGSGTTMTSMIIRTGNASVEVDSLEVAVAAVQRIAAALGGWVGNTAMTGGEHDVRSATIELKVPAARYDEALAGLRPIGKVENVSSNAEDVGEEFVDLTARTANAHRLEERLITLLATRTGKLEDVLNVERELARVREEIERFEGRLRYLKSRVATSTLTVTVHERVPLVVPGTPGENVIAEAFRDAWRNFVHFVAAFIASLGTVVPVALLAGIAALAWRRWRGPRRPTALQPKEAH